MKGFFSQSLRALRKCIETLADTIFLSVLEDFFNGFHLFIFPTETVYVCVHVLFRDALYLALFFILTTYAEKQNHLVSNLFTLLPQNDGAQQREQHHTEGGSLDVDLVRDDFTLKAIGKK